MPYPGPAAAGGPAHSPASRPARRPATGPLRQHGGAVALSGRQRRGCAAGAGVQAGPPAGAAAGRRCSSRRPASWPAGAAWRRAPLKAVVLLWLLDTSVSRKYLTRRTFCCGRRGRAGRIVGWGLARAVAAGWLLGRLWQGCWRGWPTGQRCHPTPAPAGPLAAVAAAAAAASATPGQPAAAPEACTMLQQPPPATSHPSAPPPRPPRSSWLC
jgi:hypothetical protein